jgi:hypothetical protein
MAFPRLGSNFARHGCDTSRTYGRDNQTGIQDRRLDDLLFAGNRRCSLGCHVYDRLGFLTRPLAEDFVSFHWISIG